MKQQENNFEYKSILNIGIWRSNIKELDIKFLINALYNIQKTTPSILRSNDGGYQSPPTLDTLPQFLPLVKTINREIFKITKNINVKVEGMWGNISSFANSNGVHHHHHDPTKFSGVLYLQTPPNSGEISFNNPLFISQSYSYFPQEKDILIFPSILPHSVLTNLSQQDRISIAFNFS